MRKKIATKAFTMIEMAVVLVVFAILAVVAIGVYNKITDKSSNVSATQSLDSVTSSEATFFAAYGSYTAWTADDDTLRHLGDLDNSNKGLVVTNNASTDFNIVSVALGQNGNLGLAVKSTSGDCLYRTLANLSNKSGYLYSGKANSSPCTGAYSLSKATPSDIPIAPAAIKP